MVFCKFHDAKNANPAKKCTCYTGLADRAGRQRQTLTAGTQHTTTDGRGDKGSSGYG